MPDGIFKKDLVIGHDGEEMIKRILTDTFSIKNVEINNSNNYNTLKEWDIVGINKKGQRILFEVKNDVKSEKTGNIAIEYECGGVPSGVNYTKADFWVSIGADEIYILKIGTLRNIIKEELYHREVCGGDGNRAKMYLFRKNIIRNNSKVVKI